MDVFQLTSDGDIIDYDAEEDDEDVTVAPALVTTSFQSLFELAGRALQRKNTLKAKLSKFLDGAPEEADSTTDTTVTTTIGEVDLGAIFANVSAPMMKAA